MTTNNNRTEKKDIFNHEKNIYRHISTAEEFLTAEKNDKRRKAIGKDIEKLQETLKALNDLEAFIENSECFNTHDKFVVFSKTPSLLKYKVKKSAISLTLPKKLLTESDLDKDKLNLDEAIILTKTALKLLKKEYWMMRDHYEETYQFRAEEENKDD